MQLTRRMSRLGPKRQLSVDILWRAFCGVARKNGREDSTINLAGILCSMAQQPSGSSACLDIHPSSCRRAGSVTSETSLQPLPRAVSGPQLGLLRLDQARRHPQLAGCMRLVAVLQRGRRQRGVQDAAGHSPQALHRQAWPPQAAKPKPRVTLR